MDSRNHQTGYNLAEVKKAKPNKAKTPNQTVAEAAARINAPDFIAFMSQSLQEAPLLRFAEYFETAFSAVSVAQFSWVHLFRNDSAALLGPGILAPGISRYFYAESRNWISRQPTEELSSFVLWCLEHIFADLQSQQFQDLSAKSLIGIFVALALVLEQRPYALVHVSPTLRETSYYRGQDMLNVVAWMIAQVVEDGAVGLYLWAHNLLLLWNENKFNPLFRLNLLKIVTSICGVSNDLSMLQSGTIKIGERIIPPFVLEILIGVVYPSSDIIEDGLFTRRFQEIYCCLKKVAFAGCKPLKEEARKILYFAIKAAGETNNDLLYYEGVHIFAWCLSQNVDCYCIWDEVYLENIKASINILKHISSYWSKYRVKLAPIDLLRGTLENFRQKNETTIAKGEKVALFEEADKFCKVILKKSSGNQWSTKLLCFFTVLALLVATVLASLAF